MSIFSKNGKNGSFTEDRHLMEAMIGEKSHFKGEVNVKGSLHLSGRFEGRIFAEGEVYVTEKSSVRADITAAHVYVAGVVEGNVTASQGIEITATGKIFGDINAGKLMIEEGAAYKGRIIIGAHELKVAEAKEPEEKVFVAPAPQEFFGLVQETSIN